jgi:nucleoside phosphorylase
MKKICFLFAMHAEAAPLIEKFGLERVDGFFAPLPPVLYRGEHNGKEILVVLNGQEKGLDLVGCEPATLTAQQAISRLQPDLLINAGTCGAFKAKGSAIGDVYLSRDYICFHDRRVGDDGGWYEMGVGFYPCYDATQMAADLGFKLGHCTTGSSLDMAAEDLALITRNGGELKDMEAAAIAWVASLYKTPLLCVKSVTDLVDGGRATEEEFRENLAMAADKLREACFKILDYLLVKE